MSIPNHRAGAEWRAGWPLVLGGLVGMGAGPGLFQNISSLFIPGLIAEFGWTRGEIATAAGVGLLGCVAIPFFGRATDRAGPVPVIAFSLLLLGATYLSFTRLAGELWHYQVMVLCLALGVPGTSAVAYGRLIATRFVAHRGLALGVATSGLSVTTLLMPPLVGAAITREGWRGGFVVLAFYVVAVALPLTLLALRRVGPVAPLDTAGGPSARAARREGRFWRLGLTAFCVNFATVGLVTQLVPLGLERGLGEIEAALLVTAFGSAQLVARVAIGALVDRLAPHRVAAAVALLSAAGFALLELSAPGLAALWLIVFLAGLMNGAENDLLPFFAARLFGVGAYGETYGSLLVIALLGTAAGVVGFGRLRDATGAYDLALALGVGAMVAAALLFLSLRPRADG
ncbi:MFS transporter [Sphingomonas sp. BK345]|uniref:MFS transporter n=1 Tax=Sphingomonas sp. BK345 TaxID=2586980 RepID=UPI001621948A|nr:MFS transporter [Sphingomonas sp. BK345]MBB3474992.1 putative MFS family arabinose efflux permease [Sphingomonas sp. BK345]